MSHQEVIFFSRFVKAEDATKALKEFKINAFNRDLKVSPGSTVKLSHYQLESFENDDNVEQASKSQKKIDKKIWQQMLNDAQTNLEDGITSYQFIYVETHGKVGKGQSRSQLLCQSLFAMKTMLSIIFHIFHTCGVSFKKLKSVEHLAP